MKKIWKIILIVALIIIVGVSGTAYYLIKVKTYEVADKKVDQIIDSKYNIALPGETKPGKQSQTSTKTNAAVKNSDNQSTNPSNQSENGKSDSNNTTTSENTTAEVSAESIKEKYRPSFESLESQANGRINSLVANAIAEYKGKKNSGESISFGYFYQKYNAAGQRLESQTDSTFQYIYSALQADLKNNGFDPGAAKEFKATYESAKKSRETALLSKAKAELF